MLDLLGFLKEISNVLKRFSSWILSDDTFNLMEFFLHGRERLLVRAADPCDFQGFCSLQESLRSVRQLTNYNVPESKTLVTRCTVWKDAGVASGALITTDAFDPLVAETLPGRAVALWGLDATLIAVTS